MRKLREPTITVDDHLKMLSPSEREVLSHLAAGRSNREIAARVCLSESAVKKHVTSLMRKIEVQSRTEAAIFALRVGLEAG
jgi:DNA-binding NarL/FixJ family response regulator